MVVVEKIIAVRIRRLKDSRMRGERMKAEEGDRSGTLGS
jgi:hypothetical protein